MGDLPYSGGMDDSDGKVVSEGGVAKWIPTFVGMIQGVDSGGATLPRMTDSVEVVDHGGRIFDTVVVGGGPAGISAAIYAVRKNLKVALITKNIGGQAALSGDIENLIGYSLISGVELASKFRDEVERFKDDGLLVKEGEEVVEISGADPDFVIKTASGGEYHGKTVIIASGRVPRMMNVPGEKQLLGRGVATCATCDAPLFKGKDVAVIGGGNSALDAAFALLKVANSVTIINLTEEVKGDSILMQNVKSSPKVKILNKHQVIEFQGEQSLTAVRIEDLETKGQQVLPVMGAFIEIGWTPSTFFDKVTQKNKVGEIMVDEYGQTIVPGIFAAGDVNDLWGEQIIIAAGEGAKTALRVAEHIAKIPHQMSSNMHEQG